jgi:hypothetical protein
MEHLNQQNNLVYLRDDAQRFQKIPDNDSFFFVLKAHDLLKL